MAYVWTCTDFDSDTQTCLAEGWVQVSTWVEYMPTVEQANAVGFYLFAAVCVTLAMQLLLPPRFIESD